MGIFSFGSGMGGMGGFGRKDKKDEVNIFSISKEDRQRQRELLARQERNSFIQVIMLGFALLFVLVMFFFFRGISNKPGAPKQAPVPAASVAKNNDGPDEFTLHKMMEQLVSPDVRPTAEELAPAFEPLAEIDPAVLAAAMDETNLTENDAYVRNHPKAEAVAQAVRYLRTHQENLKDFKADPAGAALPFAAVAHPDAARGKFATLEGELEQVEKGYCGYGYLPIEDAALQKAAGVKELHLFYFDVTPRLRSQFYFGSNPPVDEDPAACGVTAKLGKFAVLVPSDLRPNYEANLPEIDAGGKPQVHMVFQLRMNAVFLGDHLVLQPKVGNSNKRVVVPLYVALDPLPWRSDIDKPGSLGPKVKTQIVHTNGGTEVAVPASATGVDGGTSATPPAAGSAAGATGADGGPKPDGAATAQPKDGEFIPMSPKFEPLEELTGKEDAFDAIPVGSSIEEIKEASQYTHSFEPFHLIIRYLRSHTSSQIHAQMLKRQEANLAAFKDGAKVAANHTNTVNNPIAYYGQPFEFQGWVVKCWNPRDFWEQDYGQESGEHANSGVTHTSTWLIRDDRVNFYCVTVPKSTTEILGPEFRGDLNNLTGLNMRVTVQGIFLQRLPLQKQNFEYDTEPFYVAMDLKRVEIAPKSSHFYDYLIAAAFAVMILAVIFMIYKDRKPDNVVRDQAREHMFKRLREAGKLTKAPGEPIQHGPKPADGATSAAAPAAPVVPVPPAIPPTAPLAVSTTTEPTAVPAPTSTPPSAPPSPTAPTTPGVATPPVAGPVSPPPPQGPAAG